MSELMEKPLPCPFCGSEGALSVGGEWVKCSNTDCAVESPFRMNKAEAIAAWNRRTVRAHDKGGKKNRDSERLDFLQSLCPKKNKSSYDFNLAWTAYGAYHGGHVAVRGRKHTYYRQSIRRAIDAVLKAERKSRRAR